MATRPLLKHEFSALLGQSFDKSRRRAVALSGGVDSFALALLLKEHVGNDYGVLFAFTVNHKLRSCSTQEAQAVHASCQALGIQHEILDIPPLPGTGIEANARLARYTALTQRCLDYNIYDLYLAHHADDQAETILMRLMQGSRWRGMIGMREHAASPVSRSIHEAHRLTMHRPLLTIPKSRLIATCQKNGLIWHEDKTNADMTLTLRNAIRYALRTPKLLPRALRSRTLLHNAKVLRDADDSQRLVKREIFKASNAALCRSSCGITWTTKPLTEITQNDDFRSSFLEDICSVIAPTKDFDRGTITNVLKTLLKHNQDGIANSICGCGLLWQFANGQCRVERQPFLRNEKHYHIVQRHDSESVQRIQFDRRFWISLRKHNSAVIVRSLMKQDIGTIKSLIKDRVLQDQYLSFCADVKGIVRFTLPIIIQASTGAILALPSAGIVFDDMVQWECSLVAEHIWKSLQGA